MAWVAEMANGLTKSDMRRKVKWGTIKEFC